MSRSEIPKELKAAAIEIAQICEKNKLRYCEATLMPSLASEFHDKVEFRWDNQPHGTVPRAIRLKYEKWDTVDVPTKEN